jgi:glucan 1,3-beta-glucosidase
MPSLRAMGALTTALCTLLTSSPSLVSAAPTSLESRQAPAGYWMETIERQGTVWGNDNNYKVFRNVKDYGAVGDGNTDDTAAINKAISESHGAAIARCGNDPWCDSTTVAPAIVYLPKGTYKVSTPIQMYYYTQFVGDALNRPVIAASADFTGMAVLDADPYNSTGGNWWTNQNNFFRQVRNLEIDLTGMPESAGAGIHWQVAQATSLQNIKFTMHPKSPNNKQQGIFMDNGSGGWASDLEFVGGNMGAFLGSQQFTVRNLKFTGQNTAIFLNWDWGWTMSNITIEDCGLGLDMANNPSNQTVGSVVFSDSKISNTPVGVNISWTDQMVPASGANLILDNVDMTTGVAHPVQPADGGADLLQTTSEIIKSWATGDGYNYDGSSPLKVQRAAGPIKSPNKEKSLLDSNGNIFGRSKPQYEDVPATQFKSAKTFGCKGDGETDDTACVQKFLDSIEEGQIAYFDHGAYIVSATIRVPKVIKIVGEIWSLLVATGFTDPNKPTPVFQIGQPGDQGAVEISDIIFQTKGNNGGAIMIEWNLASEQGKSGMWDSHVRIGGSLGTKLESTNCPTTQGDSPKEECQGVFLMFHATSSSKGIYCENTWFWVADHDLDTNSPRQISVYSGRGVFVESPGPTWFWGTASEHSIFYNYQFKDAGAFFGGFMQTETPYMQPVPLAPAPFEFNSDYDDPTFTVCKESNPAVPCQDAWGMRIWNSKDMLIYSTGMYSFFNNYKQLCTPEQNCQENMIHIQNSQVDMYAVSTKAAVNMIVDDDVGLVKDADHRSNFCATIAYYFTTH